VNLKKD
jgi:hypothetical protein